MGYHARIENPDIANFLTSRTRFSELWFIQNPALENDILGYAAKYAQQCGAKIYGIALEGSHVQMPAWFPNANRGYFMQCFNSSTARAVQRRCPNFRGGPLFESRYSGEFLPGSADLEHYFFYTALQAVHDGLVEYPFQYPGFNFFDDAVNGVIRTYTVVSWKKYNAARRYRPDVRIEDYTETVELKFERLPGYEHLTQEQYAELMYAKLEVKRQEAVALRRAKGLGFVGPDRLKRIKPGTPARKPKKSTRFNYRPRVLSVCPIRRAEWNAWYRAKQKEFRLASARYRAGELDIRFPDWMFKPHIPTRIRKPPPD